MRTLTSATLLQRLWGIFHTYCCDPVSPNVDDAVVLMRTPHLGARYAAFDVPLHFNKLDMKAYLKDVYNVDVLHIRSVVVQAATRNIKNGQSRDRDPSTKKMTVQLVKPFVYPEAVDDLAP